MAMIAIINCIRPRLGYISVMKASYGYSHNYPNKLGVTWSELEQIYEETMPPILKIHEEENIHLPTMLSIYEENHHRWPEDTWPPRCCKSMKKRIYTCQLCCQSMKKRIPINNYKLHMHRHSSPQCITIMIIISSNGIV